MENIIKVPFKDLVNLCIRIPLKDCRWSDSSKSLFLLSLFLNRPIPKELFKHATNQPIRLTVLTSDSHINHYRQLLSIHSNRIVPIQDSPDKLNAILKYYRGKYCLAEVHKIPQINELFFDEHYKEIKKNYPETEENPERVFVDQLLYEDAEFKQSQTYSQLSARHKERIENTEVDVAITLMNLHLPPQM